MVYPLLLLISLIISSIAIPILQNFGIKKHLCDDPTGDVLKVHKKPIPYLGGIGIFLGLSSGLITARLFHQVSGLQAAGIIIGSIIILFLGFWDDLKWKKNSHPLIKLLCQFIAGFLIIFILLEIGVNFHFSINPILGALISAFYIVGAMNAINMQDGLDGIAGGVVGISLIAFSLLSFLSNNTFALILSLSLLGGVIGFLLYNWHPASIFMGDNGSHFLGFSLAVLAIMFTGHPIYNFPKFIGPVLIIGLPVLDTTWAIIRRTIQGKSPFQGDRGHLYDRLHQKGLSVQKTALICCSIQAIIVSIGFLLSA
ncbi:undecaprenyl/decaprenyl-phosphate alpha-N-acetylglucosaminyl 1-phosphate transferase [bacterium]|nr:undecaprenyl/decaprenyl-phosphate alpha-N-acetylglucosaminyl 1-phosphate transferase [bacterium]